MIARPRLRVFLDTNVMFSGVYAESGAPKRLLDACALGQFQAVVSRVVLDELARNLRTKAPAALPALERVFKEVSFEMADDPPERATQRWFDAGLGSDAPIIVAALAAAMHSGVDYFCTGDRRVLAQGHDGALRGLNVISPAGLVRLLQEDRLRA